MLLVGCGVVECEVVELYDEVFVDECVDGVVVDLYLLVDLYFDSGQHVAEVCFEFGV